MSPAFGMSSALGLSSALGEVLGQQRGTSLFTHHVPSLKKVSHGGLAASSRKPCPQSHPVKVSTVWANLTLLEVVKGFLGLRESWTFHVFSGQADMGGNRLVENRGLRCR